MHVVYGLCNKRINREDLCKGVWGSRKFLITSHLLAGVRAHSPFTDFHTGSLTAHAEKGIGSMGDVFPLKCIVCYSSTRRLFLPSGCYHFTLNF